MGGGCYQGLSKKRSFLRQILPNFFSCQKTLILAPAISALGIITLVFTLFISTDFIPSSYAINDPNSAMIDNQHYVSLSVSDANLAFIPSGDAVVDSKQVNVTLATNVPTGAKLYLSTADNTNALYKDGDPASSGFAIQSVGATTTLANLPANTWGYSLNNANFQAVPTASNAALIAEVDGSVVGTTSGGVISATVPVYYGAKVDSSLPAGTYSNKVVYAAIGTIPVNISSVTVGVGGEAVDNLQVGDVNTITVTTDLMTSEFGTPRVYYTTTSPAGTTECGNVSVAKNAQGYMTITCTVTPTAAATGVTLHITQGSSGDWKWGDFTHVLPDIIVPGPDINRPATSWDDLEIMQHMTPEICASASEGDTKQLIDWRDGKTYWVAKLADGNCWMTQNLELDLSTSTPLTNELSDVTSSWTPTNNTYTSAQSGSASYSGVQSWNLGKYVWKTPNSTGSCSGSGVYDFSHPNCQSYWQNVSTWTPMTEYRTDGVTYDANTQTYDAHYLAGNYYSWNATTANSTGSSSGVAAQSICPKGFGLPDNSYNNGSLYYLLDRYGFTSSTGGGADSITRAPLFFIRSGYVNSEYHYLYSVGSGGNYWSSVAYSSSGAYGLSFGLGDVAPFYNGYRFVGRSVRCVALSA